jgi:hypothetical protein
MTSRPSLTDIVRADPVAAIDILIAEVEDVHLRAPAPCKRLAVRQAEDGKRQLVADRERLMAERLAGTRH